MYEVEVKLAVDHAELRPQLTSRARHERTVRQVDSYYDHPDRDFGETDEALRIRREELLVSEGAGDAAEAGGGDGDEVTKITYKGPLVDDASKTRRELETVVDDGAVADAILSALGFTPVASVEKEREFFSLDGYTVVLDRVAGLGEFVEVERESETVDAAREGAFDLLRSLELDPDDQIRTSYLTMLLSSDRDDS